MIKIFPSLMAAPNQLELKKVVQDLENYCDGFHLDVMDNHFVPNLTWGHLIVNPIAELSKKTAWVQLMVDEPQTIIERLELKKDDIISFHIESTDHILDVAKLIQKKECIPSLAINPDTPIDTLFEHINNFSHVLVMSVHPGFSGQEFIPETIQRIEKISEYIKRNNLHCTIGIDGGVKKTNIKQLTEVGVTDFVVGSGIFNHSDYISATRTLYTT